MEPSVLMVLTALVPDFTAHAASRTTSLGSALARISASPSSIASLERQTMTLLDESSGTRLPSRASAGEVTVAPNVTVSARMRNRQRSDSGLISADVGMASRPWLVALHNVK